MGLPCFSTALQLAPVRGLPVACADGHDLPLADSSADFLSAFDVIEHLDDAMRASEEFRRVMQRAAVHRNGSIQENG
jgi:hypothetical protein